ncbi:hypothetical protein D3C72_1462360 [compost metagenome]
MLDCLQGETLFIEHFVYRVVHHFIQLVGEFFSDQLMGDQVGHRGVQRDQRLIEVLDVQVIHFFHQAMRQVGFIQQAPQTEVGVGNGWRLQEILLSDLQHWLDLRLDASFTGHFIGRLKHFWNLFDVGADETGQSPLCVEFR